MRLRLRSPRQLAKVLIAAARRDRDEVAEYLEHRHEEWEALAEATPGAAADILEQLDEETAAELLVELDADDAAEILEEIAPELAAELVEDIPAGTLAAAISEMTTESAADLLAELDDELTEQVLAIVDDDTENEIRGLLVYPPDSAGGLMTTEVPSLPIGLSAGEAIERLRQLHTEYEDLSYVYVIDDLNVLKGVLSFRELVFHRPGDGLEEVMFPAVSVGAYTDREEVAEICQRNHFFGVPVVDAHGRLLGMVTNEAVMEVIQDEATEDFVAAVGAGLGETVYTDVNKSYRQRVPWLLLNLAMAILVALVIEHQTGVISREPVLAALMPVVALLGGNAGNQSLAVMIRSLASDDVPGAQVPSILGRQLLVGLLNGVTVAFAAALLTWILISTSIFEPTSHPSVVALAIFLGTLLNLVVGTLGGSGIPLILRRFGLDPALAASIFTTMLTDIVGFGGFLVVASWLL